MEKILLKLAKQLMAYDEASLASLWEKYAEAVKHFEPTKRWEEAVMVLSIIQGVRFKNQLFNLHWSEGKLPGEPQMRPHPHIEAVPQAQPNKTLQAKPKGKVLAFKTGKDGEPID